MKTSIVDNEKRKKSPSTRIENNCVHEVLLVERKRGLANDETTAESSGKEFRGFGCYQSWTMSPSCAAQPGRRSGPWSAPRL
jgi:hypothetical protein